MEQKIQSDKRSDDRMIRLLSTDIEGRTKIYPGLTKIKGISWSFSNAICKSLKLDKNRKIGNLNDEEIKKISEFVKNPKIPSFVLNRRVDFETGKEGHLTGTDLELKNDFDVKRLKKIKSYRGLRHSLKLPVRGQRTRGNFRKNRAKSVGIKKKKVN